MLITCEKCRSVYSIADKAVAGNGRKVKCAKCFNIWTILPIVEEAPVSLDIPTEGIVADIYMAEKHEASSILKTMFILLVAAILLVSLVSFPGFFAKFPPLKHIFAKYNMYHQNQDIDLTDVQYKIIDGDLIITGKFINQSNQEKPLPKVRYILLDEHRNVIFNSVGKYDNKPIEANESREIYAKISNLSDKAAYILLDTDNKLEFPIKQ